jgi:ketosteroid isomerase-like protein
MKRKSLFAIATTLSLLITVCAAAQSTGGSTEEQIEKLENDRAQAVVKGDVAALEKTTADDYTIIDRAGRIRDKQATMGAIKSGDIKLTSNKLSDLKVRVYGDTAVVTGRSDAEGSVNGTPSNGPVRFTRVYVKKDGQWQSVAFQQTPITSE